MALPVTITGIALFSGIATLVGPFKSSAGNYYFFGRDSTTATTLQCFKSTAPDTSWSSIATKTGFTTTVISLGAWQVADVIHLAVMDGTANSSVNYKYQTFNMATDAFVTAETILSATNITGTGSPAGGCDIVVRSTGEVVTFFNGLQTKTSGTFYCRVYYSRRTAVNTWSAAIEVDASQAFNTTYPIATLGASDRVHFNFYEATTGNNYQRTITSANVLQTQTLPTVRNNDVRSSISYLNGATTKCIVAGANGVFHFDSADTPTPVGLQVSATNTAVMNDGTTVYVVAYAGSNIIVFKSTDDGVSFDAGTTAYTGTTPSVYSDYASIYTRGGNYVIPYFFVEGSAIKYNEYVVRSAITAWDGSAAWTHSSTLLTFETMRLQAASIWAHSSIWTADLTSPSNQWAGSTAWTGIGALTANILRFTPALTAWTHGSIWTANTSVSRAASAVWTHSSIWTALANINTTGTAAWTHSSIWTANPTIAGAVTAWAGSTAWTGASGFTANILRYMQATTAWAAIGTVIPKEPANMLLHMDGTNGSTTFTDATGRHTLSVNAGAPVIDTSASEFGGASAFFDGSSILATDVSSDFTLPGDFTVDFWFNVSTPSAQHGFMTIFGLNESLIYISGGVLRYYLSGQGITGNTPVTTGWHHAAMTRQSGTHRLFLDGIKQTNEYFYSGSYPGTQFGIGGGVSNFTTGWLDEIRFVNGVAIWTNDFTPPATPYDITTSIWLNRPAAAAWSGTGGWSATYTAPTIQQWAASSAWSGVGAFTANILRTTPAATAWAAAGGWSANILRTTPAIAAWAGVGALTSTANLNLIGSSVWAGASTFGMIPSGITAWTGSLAWTGTGALVATVTLQEIAAAAWAGTGALTATGLRTTPASIVWTGTGAWTIGGAMARPASAAWAGTGALAATVNLQEVVFAAWAGASAFNAIPFGITGWNASTAWAGTGALAASVSLQETATAAWAGTGTQVANALRYTFSSLAWAGASTLTDNVTMARPAVASWAGAGTWAANPTGQLLGSAAWAGTSAFGLIAAGITAWNASIVWVGASNLIAKGTFAWPVNAAWANTVSLSPIPSQLNLPLIALWSGTGTFTAAVSWQTLAAYAAWGVSLPLNTTGLLGYYPFDDTSWTDSSGQVNNLTPAGSPSTVPGQNINAVHLGGTSSFLFANAAAFNLATTTSEITITAWIRTSATSGIIVSLRSASGTPITSLVVGNDGFGSSLNNLMSAIRDNAGGVSRVTSTIPVADGNWHHVAMTRSSGKVLSLYIDGVFNNSVAGSSTSGASFDNASSAVGRDPVNAGLLSMNGDIDDLRIYNRALPATEINNVYQFRQVSSFVVSASLRMSARTAWAGASALAPLARLRMRALAQWANSVAGIFDLSRLFGSEPKTAQLQLTGYAPIVTQVRQHHWRQQINLHGVVGADHNLRGSIAKGRGLQGSISKKKNLRGGAQ